MLKRFTGEREFSDFFNPILLRELKRAVRSRFFVGAFVLVQLAMILFVTFGMATATTTGQVQSISAIFWVIIGIYVVVLNPLMGFNAIAQEYRDGRHELLVITQLNTNHILLGKLFALNIQGWLTVLSLAPYLTVRYFAGAINPIQELLTVAGILYASIIATTLTVSSSAARTRWGRVVFFLFGGFLLFLFSGMAGTAAAGAGPIGGIAILIMFQSFFSFLFFMSASGMLNRQAVASAAVFDTTPMAAL
ncbi:ABC transporter permease [Cerasicoccus maritimus]|uniref:ABC transporter permease n=1 Tax=Cerasicoccus maritimus TaxID=490089 RepID=UPI0028526029|nr:hypothetical protein [Cerasicoccus maritimus]